MATRKKARAAAFVFRPTNFASLFEKYLLQTADSATESTLTLSKQVVRRLDPLSKGDHSSQAAAPSYLTQLPDEIESFGFIKGARYCLAHSVLELAKRRTRRAFKGDQAVTAGWFEFACLSTLGNIALRDIREPDYRASFDADDEFYKLGVLLHRRCYARGPKSLVALRTFEDLGTVRAPGRPGRAGAYRLVVTVLRRWIALQPPPPSSPIDWLDQSLARIGPKVAPSKALRLRPGRELPRARHLRRERTIALYERVRQSLEADLRKKLTNRGLSRLVPLAYEELTQPVTFLKNYCPRNYYFLLKDRPARRSADCARIGTIRASSVARYVSRQSSWWTKNSVKYGDDARAIRNEYLDKHGISLPTHLMRSKQPQ